MANKLNDKIWNEYNLNPDIRKKLLKVANDFIIFSKIKNLKIHDIVLTGSLANFNWNSRSDIDLHIIFDLSNFKKHITFIYEYLQTKKALWNQKHNITIFGFEVEIYPEHTEKRHKSSGIYSLIKDKWIVKPLYKKHNVDKELVKKKYQNEVDKILSIEKQAKSKNINVNKILTDIEKYKEIIKNKRTAALKEEGEMSVINIVFKMLRNNGFFQKLNDLEIKVYDDSISMENKNISIKEQYCKGDKFVLTTNIAYIRGNNADRFKIINEYVNDDINMLKIRNLRTRKDYNVEKRLLIKLSELKYIQK